MKRLILTASMLLAFSVTAFAQSVSVKEVISSATDPSTCIVGKLYINTTSPGKVWARIGGACVRVDGVAGAAPGGADTQVQFNDGGVFGGDAGFTYNKTTDTATASRLVAGQGGDGYLQLGASLDAGPTGGIRLFADTQPFFAIRFSSDWSGRIARFSDALLSADRTYQLPNADGTFVVGAAGANTEVQFNNSGAFGASDAFTWNGSTLRLQNAAVTIDSDRLYNFSTGASDGYGFSSTVGPHFSLSGVKMIHNIQALSVDRTVTWPNANVTIPTSFGDVTGPASSVDNEIALFSGTSGKVVKRATTSGLLRGVNGVIGPATAGDISSPLGCSDSGSTDTYACNLSPAISFLSTGYSFRFKANTANTGAATVNFNGTGAVTIKKAAGGITTDLEDNDIRAGQWVEVVYNGTNYQMLNPVGNVPALRDVAQTFTGNQSFAGVILPDASNTRDLGSSSLRFKDAHIGSSIFIGTNNDLHLQRSGTTSLGVYQGAGDYGRLRSESYIASRNDDSGIISIGYNGADLAVMNSGGVIGFSATTNAAGAAADSGFSRESAGVVRVGDGGLNANGTINAAKYKTGTNCADNAGAAACDSASSGAVVIDAGATTVVVSTTAVTANSRITITEDSSLGTELGITCNTSLTRTYAISARTAGTSFTINTSAAPVTNAACLTYRIVN
jgi:hypothetical protein